MCSLGGLSSFFPVGSRSMLVWWCCCPAFLEYVPTSDGNDFKSNDLKSRFKITYVILWSYFKSFVWRRSWFWFKIKFHVILILKSLFNHLKSLLNQFEKLIEENSDFAVKVVQYAIISGSGCWLVRNTSILGQEKVSTTTPSPPHPRSLTLAKWNLYTNLGKQWLFCKNCDLDFDFDFPDKNVILIWNHCVGCDFDFDFQITFQCVILILIWNQLQSDLSHHWWFNFCN